MVYFLINILKEVPQDCISSWLCARYLFWCFFLLGAILNQHQLSTEMGLGVLHSAALKDNAFFFKYFFKKEFRDIIENNVSEDSPVQFFFPVGIFFHLHSWQIQMCSKICLSPSSLPVCQISRKPNTSSGACSSGKAMLAPSGHCCLFWGPLSSILPLGFPLWLLLIYDEQRYWGFLVHGAVLFYTWGLLDRQKSHLLNNL